MDRTPRIVMRVEITPEVRGLLSATSRDFGMTQTATLCRLIEWFSHQPREVRLLATQPWIQGQSPSAARALLETATTREDAPAPGVPHNLPPIPLITPRCRARERNHLTDTGRNMAVFFDLSD